MISQVMSVMNMQRPSEAPEVMPERPLVQDLPACILYACGQLVPPFRVKINITQQEDIVLPKNVRRASKSKSRPLTMAMSSLQDSGSELQQLEDISSLSATVTSERTFSGDVVVLTLVKDSRGNYVEVLFNRCCDVPVMLLQILRLCLPYHPRLHNITIRWGPLTGAGLYEISKLLPTSNLTEVCLDDSPVAAHNYEVLLQQPSGLRVLSLSRCGLDDQDCANLTRLLAPCPAVKLRVLALSTNYITDAGARAIALMLRANRTLRHLNVAGNQITDVGAIQILESLCEFPLTHNELEAKKLRHLDYIKTWNETLQQCMKELMMDPQRKVSTRKKGILRDEGLRLRAHTLTTERVGVLDEPFSKLVARAGQHYCIGNLALCSLNLSYNSLAYPSLLKLRDVLIYQSWHATAGEPGLVRLAVDGNCLPQECDTLRHITEMLDKAQQPTPKVPKHLRATDKKGKISVKS